MLIEKNISLKEYNSFGIDVNAESFARVSSIEELNELNSNEKQSLLILGGGSNMLLTKNIDGLVIKNEIKGISITDAPDETVIVTCGAGENWHRFVLYCIEQDFGGLENLSLIPGNVGASPMQNIGAYGVEIKDVFHSLQAWHIREKKLYDFSKNDCGFGYRESVFKNKYKGEFIILNVSFKLTKKHVFNITYGAIKQELEAMGIQQLSINAISQAVISIRRSKLPDPALIGNAGSFFKNPMIPNAQLTELKQAFPGIVSYPVDEDRSKLAAGWLIEQCGWKGFRRGDAGCHSKQALVLVNYGNATGQEILQLSNEIIDSVKRKFSVELEREVNIV